MDAANAGGWRTAITNCWPTRRCNCRAKPTTPKAPITCTSCAIPAAMNLKKHLEANGVGCALHYPLPLHLQKCYASLGYKAGRFSGRGKSRARMPEPADLSGTDRSADPTRRRGRQGILRERLIPTGPRLCQSPAAARQSADQLKVPERLTHCGAAAAGLRHSRGPSRFARSPTLESCYKLARLA